LARRRDGRFASVRVANGLPSDFLTHIADDGSGHLWFGSANGVFRVSKTDLNRCADGELPTVSCLTYGRGEGMNAASCSGGSQPAGCRTADGSLWFPTSKGLIAINPANVRTNPLAPPVIIEQLRVDGAALPPLRPKAGGGTELPRAWFGEVEIAPGWHDLEFQFTGLSFVAPQKVRFRWQLEGWEPDWVEGGNARQVSYRFLPPGHYYFRVTACNNDGVWNPTGATLAFRVRPAFWQTWWFRGATAAGVLAALVGTALVVQRRKYRLKLAELERRRSVERERLRIAQDIHDEVGSSLTRVGMLAEAAEATAPPDDPNRTRVQGIAATTREIVRAMDEIVWAVNPRNDTLTGFANYLVHYVEDLMRHSEVQIQLRVPVRLPERVLSAEARHNVFLAAKEALHNAVKHARARQIELSLACERECLTVTVHDDGEGFDPTGVPAGGDGLLNMRERMESLGGRFRLRSAPGQGTTVELNLPMPP
jgi:signal transduction histidine kinase